MRNRSIKTYPEEFFAKKEVYLPKKLKFVRIPPNYEENVAKCVENL